jgi:hypothetical protein
MHAASPADELLESLELQPATDMEDLLPEAPELGMDPGGPPSDDDEVETVDLDEALAPSFPSPAPPPAKDKGRITLVSGPRETEDLRRKISRPSLPDLSLEDLDPDDDDLDELTFEPEPAHSPLDDLRVDTLPPGSRAVRSVESPAVAVDPPPAPAPSPMPVSAVRKESEITTVATTPVSVQLPGDHGQTDVSIPVEVTLGRGSAQVTIHLRLTLNLNLQQ